MGVSTYFFSNHAGPLLLMNQIHSKVWNRSLGQLVVASELAHGRRGGLSAQRAPRGIARAILSMAIASALSLAVITPSHAQAVLTDAAGTGAIAVSPAAGEGTAATAAGSNAVAIGAAANAYGWSAIAIGVNASATGNQSAAIGGGATAVFTNDFAIGWGATASGSAAGSAPSFALGHGATAMNGATAVGTSAQGLGHNSSAFGGDTVANGENDIAFGIGAVAGRVLTAAEAADPAVSFSLSRNTALGSGAQATGGFGVAIGRIAVSTGAGAVALGANSNSGATASASNAIAIGGESVVSSAATSGIAIGRGASVANEFGIAQGDGVISGTVGRNVAIGSGTTANSGTSAGGAVAIGRGQNAVGDGAVALGDPNAAIGTGALALGANNTAAGDSAGASAAAGAIALGNANQAIGQGSIAVGNSSSARVAGAIALGDTANAAAGKGVAIGAGANAVNLNDVAIGAGSTTAPANTGGLTQFGIQAAGIAKTASGTLSVGVAGSERQIQNVAAGSISTASTDAINGSQLNQVVTGVNTLASSVAKNLGGGATFDPTTGAISGFATPITTIDSDGKVGDTTNPSSVGDALGALNINTTNLANNINNGTIGPVQRTTTADQLTLVAKGGTASAPGAAQTLSNVKAGVANTDAVNVSQLTSSIKGTVQYDTNADGTPNKGAVTLGGPITTDGGASNGTTLTNLAQGSLAPTSSDAVNGAQVNTLASSVAQGLGGASAFDPATGQINTSLSYGGGTYDSVQGIVNAMTGDSTVAGVKYFHANSTGEDSNAAGSDSIAIGTAANAMGAGDVALGAGSVTAAVVATEGDIIDNKSYDYAGDAPQSTVSIGAPGAERTLTNLAAGRISASSTDAVNGSQLYATDQAVNGLGANLGNISSTVNQLATMTAGGFQVSIDQASRPTPQATGTDSAAGGAGSVASGDGSLALGNDSNASGKNSTVVGNGAVASGTNSVSLGNGSNDGGQSNVVSIGSVGGERKLINVAAGAVTEGSTDAVNGGQLYETRQDVQSIADSVTNLNAHGVEYFHANSTGADSQATGSDAIAIGTQASASGVNSLASGVSSQATGRDSTALGADAVATADNATALGAGSIADRANSVSVGSATQTRVIANVSAGTQGTDAANVDQLRAVEAGGVKYDHNADGSVNPTSISVGTSAAPAQIHNVASATAPGDAPNWAQVQGALGAMQGQTNDRFDSLQHRVDGNQQQANRGIAAAAALMNNMPYVPGRTALNAGVASYRGESALGVGVSRCSDSGRVNLNAGISAAQGDAPIFRVGVGVVLGD